MQKREVTRRRALALGGAAAAASLLPGAAQAQSRAKRFGVIDSMVGSDRVMIGTDNYAFMDIDEPMALVELLKLKAADRGRILTDTAVRLFRL